MIKNRVAALEYVQLTNSDTASALVQLQHGEVKLRATVGENRPSRSDGGVIFQHVDGEWDLNLATFFHLPGANRLWAKRISTQSAGLLVSHQDA